MMDELVAQLKEQVATLTAYLNDQNNSRAAILNEMREKCKNDLRELKEKHEFEIRNLEKQFEEDVALMRRQHKSVITILEKVYKDKIKRLKNEYALLQAALRNYRTIVQNEIGKLWDTKLENILLQREEKTAKEIQIARVEMEKQLERRELEMTKKFEEEVAKKVEVVIQQALATSPSISGSEEQVKEVEQRIKSVAIELASSSNMFFNAEETDSSFATEPTTADRSDCPPILSSVTVSEEAEVVKKSKTSGYNKWEHQASLKTRTLKFE